MEKNNLQVLYKIIYEGYANQVAGAISADTKSKKDLTKITDEEKIVPGNGIYAVYAQPEDYTERLKGMMSIGFRPTVDGKKRVIEVNIFDFDKEIYGQSLKVFAKKYLREEIKFDGLGPLVKQIDQDKVDSLQVLWAIDIWQICNPAFPWNK